MIRSIDSNQTTKRNNTRLMLSTAAGAAIGTSARYLVPTKAEMGTIKTAADTFFSSASTIARGANRSMLKYGAIGAIAAASITLLTRLFNNKQQTQQFDTIEFSRIQAIVEAPIASEFYLYGD